MDKELFGTDGIRGKANQYPITPAPLLKIATAAAHLFMKDSRKHIVVIGKDTRQSGYMIESALTAGFTSMGVDVIQVGPMPTPAISILTRAMRADMGVVISASHNPYDDNGIKFFGPTGHKLTDAQEMSLEKIFFGPDIPLAQPKRLGKARRIDAQGRYVEYAKSTLPRQFTLEGLKIVIDCANGAAYKVAPQILWELGAEIISIGVTPNGININEDCGATSPKKLSETVLEHKADLGIALDGDADRLIMVDERGHVIDGDNLMALIAHSWKKDGKLKGNKIVATLMSNLALERYLKTIDLELIRANVGDRYVLEKMLEHDCNFGGEQSGHLILSDYSSTGDGLIAALQVLLVFMKHRENNPNAQFSQIARVFTPVPQVLKNVKISDRAILQQEKVQSAIKEADNYTKNKGGRLLVRPSGTEPLIRIMVEADDQHLISEVIANLEDVILQA